MGVRGSAPRLDHLYPREDSVPIVQEAGWASGPVWTGGKSRPHRDSIPDHPARSSVAIPTELRGLHGTCNDKRKWVLLPVWNIWLHSYA